MLKFGRIFTYSLGRLVGPLQRTAVSHNESLKPPQSRMPQRLDISTRSNALPAARCQPCYGAEVEGGQCDSLVGVPVHQRPRFGERADDEEVQKLSGPPAAPSHSEREPEGARLRTVSSSHQKTVY